MSSRDTLVTVGCAGVERTSARRLFILACALLLSACLIWTARAEAACSTGVVGVGATTTTFGFCGGEQSFVVPTGTTSMTVTVIGSRSGTTFGTSYALGGEVTTTIPVTGGQTYYVVVGGPGGDSASSGDTPGGYNGGGRGQASGSGGGGASDIRTVSCGSGCPGAPASATLMSRLVVGGGGGGGGGGGYLGGAGGSATNGDGGSGGSGSGGIAAGHGGTQTAGGAGGPSTGGAAAADGVSGTGGASGDPACSGGGGGGYYGGGGASGCGSAGGGSSFGPAGSTFSAVNEAAVVQVTPVVATGTTLTSSADPSASGDAVTFTATVASADATPGGGTVQFYDGADALGTPQSLDPTTGKATYTTSPVLSVGSHTITAVYSGALGFSGSTSDGLVQTVDRPPVPTFSGSSPASPAMTTAPKLLGSAEAGSTVKLYTTTDCTGSPAGTGTAAAFASPGLAVTVATDDSTTFYATVTDAGGTSLCSSSTLTYVNDSTPPGRPALSSTNPASPSASLTVKVLGSAEAGSTVRLFTTADCSGTAVASGSAASFASPGLTVTVPADRSTTFRATATDG
ncbi:MAG: hypothetical protein JWN65_1228, partial [Solirubrobacterales bacterium]|nr:hypothetical protein [Solirubrobacterales bacterium]